MTQPSRTTESINRDNAGIRDIMLQIRELTVPDRATLALGLIGHLATLMNRSQMTKLMGELQEQVERVQDVPPSRQRDMDAARGTMPEQDDSTQARLAGSGGNRGDRAGSDADQGRDERQSLSSRDAEGRGADAPRGRDAAAGPPHQGVGQAGRGEFRSGKLL